MRQYSRVVNDINCCIATCVLNDRNTDGPRMKPWQATVALQPKSVPVPEPSSWQPSTQDQAVASDKRRCQLVAGPHRPDKTESQPYSGICPSVEKSRSLFSGFATHRVARDEVAVVRLAVLELDQHGMALRRAQQRQRQLRTRREGATGRKIRARATVKPAAARHALGAAPGALPLHARPAARVA